MTTLTSAVMTYYILHQVNSTTGVPDSQTKVAIVHRACSSFNESANYLTKNFIPAWDTTNWGTLPEVFEIRQQQEGTPSQYDTVLIQVIDGVASLYGG